MLKPQQILRSRLLAQVSSIRTASGQSKGQQLRFDGQTAIVTGAGRGLGREYALLLASRGANVVINDPGSGDEDGGRPVAEQVAAEINAKGVGHALANRESVTCDKAVDRLVAETMDKFGRIDILINNAGILRDKSFAKLSIDEWDEVMSVHLRGSFLVSRACWPQMKAQKFGRIVMTSSTSGIYGNFGQANYAAAKLGLVGLSNTLAIEGARDNIHCNALVPLAASRMTQSLLPEELIGRLSPARVAPLVGWLCHRDCGESGGVFEAAGGWFGRYRWLRGRGQRLPEAKTDSGLEFVAENWAQISSTADGAKQLDSFGEHLGELMQSLEAGGQKP